jgi:hypothetical protein
MAAQNIANDAEARKRVEDSYGVEYCRQRWPEAYSRSPFFKSIIERLTTKMF